MNVGKFQKIIICKKKFKNILFSRRQSETIKEEAGTYQPMDPTNEARKKEWEQMMRGEMQVRVVVVVVLMVMLFVFVLTKQVALQGCRAVSPSTTRSSTDETEDSGGTLRFANFSPFQYQSGTK